MLEKGLKSYYLKNFLNIKGIVLWEMFTLGKTPYPGIEPGERFYDMLVKGYR